MKVRRISRVGVAALVAAFALLGAVGMLPAGAQAASGGVRFVHALPGAAGVDVFVDGTLAARDLEYGTATRYLNVSLGDHKVVVTPTGTGSAPSGTPLLSTTVSPDATNPDLLVVVEGTSDKPEAGVFPQDLSALDAGKTRFTAVHAMKDAPAIDVLRPDGSPLIQGLKYGDVFGGFDTSASAPGMAIVPAGGSVSGAILQIDSVALDAGTHYTLVVLGTVSGSVKPSYLLLSTPTALSSGNVLTRFVNGLSDDKAVDLYVNGTLTAPDLVPGDATLHIPVASGSATIDLRNAGDAPTAKPIGTTAVTLKNDAQTVVVTSGSSGAFALTAYPDNVTKLASTTARVTLIDTTGGNTSFSFGTAQLASTASSGNAQSGELPAGKYDVSAGSAKATLTLNGGTLTDLVLIGTADSPKLVVATTGLSEQPGSVAGATQVAQAPTATPTTVAQPTTAPTAAGAATTSSTQAAQPTAVPAQTTPTVTPLPGIIGIVSTNPGVNLKIYQYPRRDAYTLALAPSQASLFILGIRGPVLGTGTPSPSPTPSSTPSPGVWVFVSWTTPDGSTVTGWTLANYLSITANGKPIASDAVSQIRGIKTIPEDTAGDITGGSGVTPVSNTTDLVGTVTTSPGTNAQLRRTPDITSESLALIPSGTQVIVLSQTTINATPVVGAPKSSVWYFVRYDVSGSSAFGWVSADFIKVNRKGQPATSDEIPVATQITVGYVQGSITQVAPTIAPGLIATVVGVAPGANLQLRAQPSATALSLGLVPSGTQLPVLGRNGAGSWIQVQFQGQTGWVSSGYVVLTKNGRKVSIGDLTITNGEPNTFGTGTPTITPTGVG